MKFSSIFAVAAVASTGIFFSPSTSAQLIDITQPGDSVIVINGFNDGDDSFGPPPASEGVDKAIDNLGNKYLNFLDVASGFQVTPSIGATVVTGLRFWTANDAVVRDPASFQLEGSLNGSSFVLIANMALALPAERNLGGVPLTGNAFQEVSFANTELYTSYRLFFPTLKDAAAANSMQIAEVEFLAVPEPSTMALFGLASVAALWSRRQRANA
jgi:hypothetical protein